MSDSSQAELSSSGELPDHNKVSDLISRLQDRLGELRRRL